MKLLLTLLLLVPLLAFGSNFNLEIEDRFGSGNWLAPKTITWLSLDSILNPQNIGHRPTCGYSSFGPPLCSMCTFVSRIWYQALTESGRRYGQIVFNYRYPVTIILVMTSSVRLFFRLLRVATSMGAKACMN